MPHALRRKFCYPEAMGRFIGHLFTRLLSGAVKGLVDFVYALTVVAEFAVCLYIGYQWIFAPMAAAPGSRDSAGLLFVMLFVLAGTLVMTVVLKGLAKQVFRGLFPWWEPTLFKGT